MTLTILLSLAIVALAPFVAEAMRPRMDGAARSTAEGKFATLSQGVTHFDWLGPVRGPVAVCVHGLTTPSFVWRGVARGLALMGYRVLIYDLYGRGFSDRPRGRQDRTFFLRQLSDLLADQAVGNDITLLGYSMGGAIATAFAAEHPERLRQLILIAPAGMGVRAGPLTRFIAKTPLIGDWLMLALFPWRHRKAVERERDLPGSVANIADLQCAELKYRGYIPAVLASIRGILPDVQENDHRALRRSGLPVLAIWGREDTIIPLTAMGNLATWNRAARQEVVEGAGHGLTYTHTDAVIAAIRAAMPGGHDRTPPG